MHQQATSTCATPALVNVDKVKPTATTCYLISSRTDNTWQMNIINATKQGQMLCIKTLESLTLFWVIFRPSPKCPNRTFTFQRVCFMKARLQRVWSNLPRGNWCHSWFTTSNPSPQEPHCEVSPTIHTQPPVNALWQKNHQWHLYRPARSSVLISMASHMLIKCQCDLHQSPLLCVASALTDTLIIDYTFAHQYIGLFDQEHTHAGDLR